jgi:hypothetical protein
MQHDLVIIGNGFDIHHKIASRYSDFKEYLRASNPELVELVEEFLPVEEYWNDLEAALANIDVDHVTDNAAEFLVSYAEERWSDAYHHDYQYEVNRIVIGLSVELKKHFTDWIKQLDIPSIDDITDKRLNLPVNARYLTFNYTSTLSDIYSIPRDHILYIHGNALNNDYLILGHSWNPSDVPSLIGDSDPEDIDPRVLEGNDIIKDYFGQTFKNTSFNIKANSNFFNNLKHVSQITVLGHSLSDVDHAYFEEIVRHINRTAVLWVVSYYNESEIEHHRKALRSLGVPNELIRLIPMEKLD